ncbi:MAG: DNA repair protein RecN [Clostridia bacterium]
MLKRLYLQNFTLFESLELELEAGFNVLTGETGTGKSLLLDAIAILLGKRITADFIRKETEVAIVEGLFYLSDQEKVLLQKDAAQYAEEDTILFTRELTRSGKNICRINQKQIPLVVYSSIISNFVDFNEQNQELQLYTADYQLAVIDGLQVELILQYKLEVSELYSKLIAKKRDLQELFSAAEDREFRLELLQQKVAEIKAAKLKDREEENLLEQKNILLHAEKIANCLRNTNIELFAGDGKLSAYDRLYQATAELRDIQGYQAKYQELFSICESLTFQVEELSYNIKDSLKKVENDNSLLEQIDDRLDVLKRLKRKYGNSVQEILAKEISYEQQIEVLLDFEVNMEALEIEVNGLEQSYLVATDKLTELRKKNICILENEIKQNLADLDLQKAEIRIELKNKNSYSENGVDEVEFMFRPNPGEGYQALSKIASGGETSRIMLALKNINCQYNRHQLLIFDEIDSGIGGETVRKVAQVIVTMAEKAQVICVTHSPQLASFSKTHYKVSKETNMGRTYSKVELLTGKSQLAEIIRMLGGDDLITGREHASELLNTANKQK